MLGNKPRNLGRKKLTPRDERFILRQIKKNPKECATTITARLHQHFNKIVSVDTVRRTLKRYGLFNSVPRKKPYINKVNRIKRLDFAKRYIHKDYDFWKQVIFTDESKFNIITSNGIGKIWREKNSSLHPKNLIPTVKHGGGSVMVWGCFSAAGTGNLHFIDGIMDAAKYVNILKCNLNPSAEKLRIQDNFIFYQDNDPKHTALNSRLWLLYNCPKVLQTPPNHRTLIR